MIKGDALYVVVEVLWWKVFKALLVHRAYQDQKVKRAIQAVSVSVRAHMINMENKSLLLW